MITVVRTWRIAVIVAVIVAIGASAYASVDSGLFNPFNFFGYFTIQANLIGIAVLGMAVKYTGKERPAWLELARACATTYLVIVGIVYWTLLAGTDVGIRYPWANVIIHGVSCVVIAVDWLVEGPRTPLPWRRLWVVLIYPIVWLAVTLVRGATDGWIPYPFLNPDEGYARVAVVCTGILVVGIGVGAAVFAATRWRTVTPSS